MTLFGSLPFAAAVLSVLLAFASVLTAKKRSASTWFFFAGMILLGVDSLLTGLILRAAELFDVLRGLAFGLLIKSFVSAAWLGFSLTCSRGDYRESLAHWKLPLAIIALLPIGLSLGFQQQLFHVVPAGPAGDVPQVRLSAMGKALNAVLLVALVWILMNLEQTFRSAVGTMRWRIKFVVLGLAVIFGSRLYVRSQAFLFAGHDMDWAGVESSALLIGGGLLVIAYGRTRFAESEVYPSRAVLRWSLTVLMAGGYLFLVGVLAKAAGHFGGVESLQFQGFILLLGMSGLGVLLLSDHLRQRVHGFVGRHFQKAQHDSVVIWSQLSQRLATVKDQAGLCAVSARLVSETFEVLSVTLWLLDEQKEQLIAGVSTAPQPGQAPAGNLPATASEAVVAGLLTRPSPFDLEEVNEVWAEEFRQLNSTVFPSKGGNRWCVPLRAGEQTLGALVLADRVSGMAYTSEEEHLLQCIVGQVTSALLNLRLTDKVACAREMEAFRTMSAFFVHDLKNAAGSLNLMLKNLEAHFDDPAFREDALRAIGNTARRIDEMIGRLTVLREPAGLKPVETDLNQLVNEVLDRLERLPDVDLTTELQPVPRILADREQIRSVVTNLLLNARDALGVEGRICVRTEHAGDSVVLSVTDNGCGMSPGFLKDSLFRPFQSTKKKGLGIGMFQSRMIVEAHGGSIRVESEMGKGSTFRVSLPVKDVKR